MNIVYEIIYCEAESELENWHFRWKDGIEDVEVVREKKLCK